MPRRAQRRNARLRASPRDGRPPGASARWRSRARATVRIPAASPPNCAPCARPPRPATPGCTRSSGTATGCSPTWSMARRNCARATTWTGPRGCRPSPGPSRRCRSPTRTWTASWSCSTTRATATSPPCSACWRAVRGNHCDTWCSTCPAWPASTCRARRWSSASGCCASCWAARPACSPTATTWWGTEPRCSPPAARPASRASSASAWTRATAAAAARTGSRSSTRTATSSSSSATPRRRAPGATSARCCWRDPGWMA